MSLLSKFLARFSKSDRNKGLTGKDGDVRFLGEGAVAEHHSNCKVMLLDDIELKLEVKFSIKGQILLERVFDHLNLIEKDYFGLRYLDSTNQTHWLDPSKSLNSQLKGTPPHVLYFGVKFYAADPCKLLEEITRYQFFLQGKRDILQGRLPVPFDIATELSALAIQSELGDHDHKRHVLGYISEFRFVPNQTEEFESRVMQIHRTAIGIVPAAAEYKFLDKVKWLEMYGVDLHPVQGEGNMEYYLGLTPTGIVVYRNKSKVGNYFWPRISKITFKAKLFMVRVRDKNNEENTYAFECDSKPACKHLWKCCVEHHAFFRLKAASESYDNTGKLFSLGSKYRYSGRTEKQIAQEVANRPQPTVVRTPSRRHQRRHSAGSFQPPMGYSNVPNPSQSAAAAAVAPPQPVHPVTTYRREVGYDSAPETHRNVRAAPWESENAHKGGLFTKDRGSPQSVRSEKMMFPKHVPSGSESEGPPRRHRRSRKETDTESEADTQRRHRRRNRYAESEGEAAEAAHRRHRRRGKSAESLPAETNKDHGASLQGPYDLRPNGSINSMAQSEPGHKDRRRRKRSKSPGNKKPPEELAQHFRYIDPEAEGFTQEQMRDIQYTQVETKVEAPKVKYSPHMKHRHKSPRRRSYGELNEKSVPVPPTGEAPPPYPGDLKSQKLRNRRSAPNLDSYSHKQPRVDLPAQSTEPAVSAPGRTQPEEFLRSPASVKHNDLQTAPIVKTKNQTHVVFSGLPTLLPQPPITQPTPSMGQVTIQPLGPPPTSPSFKNHSYNQPYSPPNNTSIQNQSGREHNREDSGLGIDPENISSGSRRYYFESNSLPSLMTSGWTFQYGPDSLLCGHSVFFAHSTVRHQSLPRSNSHKGSMQAPDFGAHFSGSHGWYQPVDQPSYFFCPVEQPPSQLVPSPQTASYSPMYGMPPHGSPRNQQLPPHPLHSYKVITKPSYVEQASSEDKRNSHHNHYNYQPQPGPPSYQSHGMGQRNTFDPPSSSRYSRPPQQQQYNPPPNNYSHPPPHHLNNGAPGGYPPPYGYHMSQGGSQSPQKHRGSQGAYHHQQQHQPQRRSGYNSDGGAVTRDAQHQHRVHHRHHPHHPPPPPVRTHSEKMTEL